MSKFKVGDKVRHNRDYEVWDNAPDILVVKRVHSNGRVSFENNPLNGSSDYDDTKLYVYAENRFELVPPFPRTLTLSGTTYTLTPYEAPKLVTIDGVVYAMTEVK